MDVRTNNQNSRALVSDTASGITMGNGILEEGWAIEQDFYEQKTMQRID